MQLRPIRLRPSRGGITGRTRSLPCLTKAGAKELPGHAGHSSNQGTSTTGVRSLSLPHRRMPVRLPILIGELSGRLEATTPSRILADRANNETTRIMAKLLGGGDATRCEIAPAAVASVLGLLARLARLAGTRPGSPHARRRTHVSGQCPAGPAAEIRHHPRRRWPLVCGRCNRRGRSCQAPSGGEPAAPCHHRVPAPARAKPNGPRPRTAALLADAFLSRPRPSFAGWPAQRPPL